MPIDLPALVAHGSASSYENQAWPRERLGTREAQPAFGVLRDQLLALGRQRNAWVSMRRQRLQGLAGARERGGKVAWEIDYLVDCAGNEAVVAELLNRAVKTAGERRAEKLYLRLASDSPLITAAHSVGFTPFNQETLYVRKGRPAANPAPVRRTTPADAYPLFRLYTQITPEGVRRQEAATYGEWLAATERRWMKGGVELVAERNGALAASVRAARLPQGVMLDIVLERSIVDEVEGLVAAAALEVSAPDTPLLILAPSEYEALTRRLEAAGFEANGEYVSLMHRTTRPLTLPKAMPAVAKNAVGV